MELKCNENIGTPCDWKGEHTECRINSDHGFLGGVWWWKGWFCPMCGSKLYEVNQNTPSSDPLFNS